MEKIVIIDTGSSNILSLKRAIGIFHSNVNVTTDSQAILSANKIFFPGVLQIRETGVYPLAEAIGCQRNIGPTRCGLLSRPWCRRDCCFKSRWPAVRGCTERGECASSYSSGGRRRLSSDGRWRCSHRPGYLSNDCCRSGFCLVRASFLFSNSSNRVRRGGLRDGFTKG